MDISHLLSEGKDSVMYVAVISSIVNSVQVVPPTLADHYNMHLGYWVFSVLLWVMFPWAKFSDPGVIKTNRNTYEEAVKLVS